MLIAAKTNNSQPFKWQQRPCSYYVHACSYLVILVYTMWMLIHTIHACSYLSILCWCLFMLVHICSYYVQCTCLSILVHAYCILWPLGQTVHILLYICVAWLASNFWQVCTHGQKLNGNTLVAFCRMTSNTDFVRQHDTETRCLV